MKKISKKQMLILSLLPGGLTLTRLFSMSPDLIEKHYSQGLYHLLARALGYISQCLPLSLAEVLVSMAVLGLLGGLIKQGLNISKGTLALKAALKKDALFLVAVFSLGYFLFLLLWGFNYYRLPLAELMGLDTTHIRAEELESLCMQLIQESKKIAAGANSIVLDVKVGSGAFMKEQEKAEELARLMVEIGKKAGRRVIAILSDMEQPLGRMVGNALEVREVIDTLQGRGPEDLLDLSLVLASYMLILGEKTSSLEEARQWISEILVSGRGWEKFQEMIRAQGGELKDELDNYGLPKAQYQKEVIAEKSGYVSNLNAFLIGHSAMLLGAGRARLEDDIDYAVGIELLKKPGDLVQAGEALALLHLNDEKRMESALLQVSQAYQITPNKPQKPKLILDIIQ
jgi:hypothetical protein